MTTYLPISYRRTGDHMIIHCLGSGGERKVIKVPLNSTILFNYPKSITREILDNILTTYSPRYAIISDAAPWIVIMRTSQPLGNISLLNASVPIAVDLCGITNSFFIGNMHIPYKEFSLDIDIPSGRLISEEQIKYTRETLSVDPKIGYLIILSDTKGKIDKIVFESASEIKEYISSELGEMNAISKFVEKINTCQIDILIAYGDFSILKNRTEFYLRESFLKFKKEQRTVLLDIPSITQVDALKLLKILTPNLPDYSPETVGSLLLNKDGITLSTEFLRLLNERYDLWTISKKIAAIYYDTIEHVLSCRPEDNIRKIAYTIDPGLIYTNFSPGQFKPTWGPPSPGIYIDVNVYSYTKEFLEVLKELGFNALSDRLKNAPNSIVKDVYESYLVNKHEEILKRLNEKMKDILLNNNIIQIKDLEIYCLGAIPGRASPSRVIKKYVVLDDMNSLMVFSNNKVYHRGIGPIAKTTFPLLEKVVDNFVLSGTVDKIVFDNIPKEDLLYSESSIHEPYLLDNLEDYNKIIEKFLKYLQSLPVLSK